MKYAAALGLWTGVFLVVVIFAAGGMISPWAAPATAVPLLVIAYLGTRAAKREYTAPRIPRIGGCRECAAAVGSGHTGYCSKSLMRGGPGGVVTEADRRPLTVGDMGMG